MKKILLFASAVALMTSCAKTDSTQPDAPAPEVAKGVKFSVSVAQAGATKGEFDPSTDVKKGYYAKWYADNDKIGVFFKGDVETDQATTDAFGNARTAKVAQDIDQNTFANGFKGFQNTTVSTETDAVAFKASASGNSAYFVANNDDNVLMLSKPGSTAATPEFRAFYPYQAAEVTQDFAGDAQIVLPALAAQTQGNVKGQGIDKFSFMYAVAKSEAEYDEHDNSVSKDRLPLEFKRVNPMLYFKVVSNYTYDHGINREYNRDYAFVSQAGGIFNSFGKLLSVTLKAEGSAEPVVAASKLTFKSDDKWDMGVEDLSKGFVQGTQTDEVSEIVTTLGGANGLDWSNDATAFMSVAPVDRAGFTKGEKVTATYKFERTVLEKSKVTTEDWTVGDWFGFPTMDGWNLDEEPYIAYKKPASTASASTVIPATVIAMDEGYTIEINKNFSGTLSTIFDVNGNLIGTKQADGSAIKLADIVHFVSKSVLTDDDFKTIQKMTGLKYITLLENTSIPAEAFKNTVATYYNLPKVTGIVPVNAFPALAQTDVYMGSYNFNLATSADVREELIAKVDLVKADVAAVPSINSGFPYIGITFEDFAKLQEITVMGGDGIKLGSDAFKKCVSLTTVQYPKGNVAGAVNLEGTSVFSGCTMLPTVAIKNMDEVPDGTFSDCTALTKVTNAAADNGTTNHYDAITPVTIGAKAFYKTKALQLFDFTRTTMVKESAFEGSGLLNLKDKAFAPNAELGIASFKDCIDLVDVTLDNVVKIGSSAFKGCTNLIGNNSVLSSRTVLYVNGITKLEDSVFENCENIRFISFKNVTTIGSNFLKGAGINPTTGTGSGIPGEGCQEIEFRSNFSGTNVAAGSFGAIDKTLLFVNKSQVGQVSNVFTVGGSSFTFSGIRWNESAK